MHSAREKRESFKLIVYTLTMVDSSCRMAMLKQVKKQRGGYGYDPVTVKECSVEFLQDDAVGFTEKDRPDPC